MSVGTTVELRDSKLLESLLPSAARLIGEFLDAELGSVAESVDEGTAIKVSVIPTDTPDGKVSTHQSTTAKDASMNAYALADGATLIVSNLQSEKRFSDAALAKRGVVSAIIAPIVVRDEPVGTLGIYGTQAREFAPEDVRAAEAIAQLLATKLSREPVAEAASDQPEAAATENPPAAAREGTPEASDEEEASETPETPDEPADSDDADAAAKNRRRSPRMPYRHWQRIAPISEGVMPNRQQLYEVECCDLSNGGISLYVTSRPTFDSLVVALGSPPDERFITARVVRATPEMREGREVYQLGCQFMGRVYL